MKKDKITYLPLGILTSMTLMSGFSLMSARVNAAQITANCAVDATTGMKTCSTDAVGTEGEAGYLAAQPVTASVTISAACTMSGEVNRAHTDSLDGGEYNEAIGRTTLSVICNDEGGYAIYAVGYSNDTYGETDMIGATSGDTISTISAGNTWADLGTKSVWGMKLTAVAGTYAPTIASGYSAMHAVPEAFQMVASLPNATGTTAATASQLTATYGVSVSPAQTADTYTGKVAYVMVHPTGASMPDASALGDE